MFLKKFILPIFLIKNTEKKTMILWKIIDI